MKEEEENIQPRQQRRVGNHWASQPEKGTVGRTSKWSPATQQTPQSHNPGPFSLLAKSFVNVVPQFTKDSDKGCTPHDEYWRERRNTCIYIIYIYTDIRFGGIFENLCKNTLVFYGTGIIQDKLLHKVGNSRQGVTVQSNRRASLHPGHSVTAKCPSRSLLFLIEEDDGLRWSVIPVQQTSKNMTAGIMGTDQKIAWLLALWEQIKSQTQNEHFKTLLLKTHTGVFTTTLLTHEPEQLFSPLPSPPLPFPPLHSPPLPSLTVHFLWGGVTSQVLFSFGELAMTFLSPLYTKWKFCRNKTRHEKWPQWKHTADHHHPHFQSKHRPLHNHFPQVQTSTVTLNIAGQVWRQNIRIKTTKTSIQTKHQNED